MVTLVVTLVGNITYFIHKQSGQRPSQGCTAGDDDAETNAPSRGYEVNIQSK